MSEGFASVPGGRVWYRTNGEGGTTLLCLHGGPGFPHDYIETLADLADERAVVFFDQLGCGRSERPSDEELWRKERFVEEVAAVREELGLERVHVLGQSWGGLLALEYALTRPEGLVSLTFASPVISVPRWIDDAHRLLDAMPADVQDVIKRHEDSGFTDCLEYAAASLAYWKRHVCRLDPWPESLERAFSGFGVDVYHAMWGPSEFTCTGNLNGYDPSGRLTELDVPVLWTCGRHDEATPESIAAFQQAVRGSQLVVFEESSHTAHLEEREGYMDVLRAFLREVDATASS
ncbi:MAG: proline iminopeptidase-family hydrolase [Actinomycetota bacterium]|nr:proline iminopeptidase-family hydrolase [Actinomycetota bacterium]